MKFGKDFYATSGRHIRIAPSVPLSKGQLQIVCSYLKTACPEEKLMKIRIKTKNNEKICYTLNSGLHTPRLRSNSGVKGQVLSKKILRQI